MATLEEANHARQQHADQLAKVGAHAIGVEKGEAFGQAGWVVVVYARGEAEAKMPGALSIQHHGNDIEVPVVVQKAEPFEPQ
ncbi:hypothetical protein [Ensifer aridi]|uniref:hypothetical protein n=1 Tax=Ensifer aridi TaxID=1708715 RepID=UPI000A106CC4|nr:hypothetical protein [Ensifer aridi]